jgi:hypothetical protein
MAASVVGARRAVFSVFLVQVTHLRPLPWVTIARAQAALGNTIHGTLNSFQCLTRRIARVQRISYVPRIAVEVKRGVGLMDEIEAGSTAFANAVRGA